MNIRLNTTPVCLAKRQGVTLTKARGSEVRCLRGDLWITQDGDQRDIVLRAGESFTLDRRGPAMVWALSDASVELLPARRLPMLAHAAGGHILRRLVSWSQPNHVPAS